MLGSKKRTEELYMLANRLTDENSLFSMILGLCCKLVLQIYPNMIEPFERAGLGFHANNEGRFGVIVAYAVALARFILDAQVFLLAIEVYFTEFYRS